MHTLHVVKVLSCCVIHHLTYCANINLIFNVFVQREEYLVVFECHMQRVNLDKTPVYNTCCLDGVPTNSPVVAPPTPNPHTPSPNNNNDNNFNARRVEWTCQGCDGAYLPITLLLGASVTFFCSDEDVNMMHGIVCLSSLENLNACAVDDSEDEPSCPRAHLNVDPPPTFL